MTKKYHAIPADKVLEKLPADRRKKIDARAAELIAEEFALRELRQAREMTQDEVARKLGGRQVYVSRLESRADMKLSTLREYVDALGGRLELVVSFPKGRRVRLADLGSAAAPERGGRPVAARKKPARKSGKRARTSHPS